MFWDISLLIFFTKMINLMPPFVNRKLNIALDFCNKIVYNNVEILYTQREERE